jgi:hypothetical protein
MATGQTRYGTPVLRVPARHTEGQCLSTAFTVAVFHGAEGSLMSLAAIVHDDTVRCQEAQAFRPRRAA